jgi:hypothetical protein
MIGIGVRIICIGVLVTVYASFNGSAAQDGNRGVLQAVSLQAVPRDVPIRVRALNDDQSSLALKRDFETALKDRGFVVAGDGSQLVLSFEISSRLGTALDSPQRTFVEVEGSPGSGSDATNESKAMVNLFNSQRGGVLNEGRHRVPLTTTSRYRLDVDIDNKTTGKRLWQAWAMANLGEVNAATVTERIVPAVVARIGETVRETFDLSVGKESNSTDQDKAQTTR